MFNTFTSIVGIIITILFVVGVHEAGHFFVAKWSGVKVLRFSIGFGKALFTWHDKSGTEYVLAAIPLGGYVKMLDEDEENVPESERHLAYNRQPFYKKFAIIAAGPATNLLFAFIIYWFLFVIGFVTIAPVIGSLVPKSIAAEAKLPVDREITQVDNKNTHNWVSIIVYLLARAGDTTGLSLQLKDLDTQKTQSYVLDLSHWHLDDLKPDPLQSLGIVPYNPILPNIIGNVVANSPAAQAGLHNKDQIIAIEDKPTADWDTLVSKFVDKPGKSLKFTVKRGTQILVLPVMIGSQQNYFLAPHGYLGFSPAFEWPKKYLQLNKYGPLEAMSRAWDDIKLFTDMNFMVLGKMITGKISLESLGGPITIFQSAGNALNNGALSFLSFLAFLSVSIGIINILPIPGLDGGHLLFQLIEAITRKPLQPRVVMLMYRFGLILLVLVMVQALVNDILRLR
jgi:regulator of sigma E protease